MKRFYKLMAEEDVPKQEEILVVQAGDLFLTWAESRHTPETFAWEKHYLKRFCDFRGNGKLKACEVKPCHVTRWLDANPKWTGPRRAAVTIVKRVFSWAEEEGLIAANPLRKLKKPAGRSRKRLLTESELNQIHEAVPDQEFKNFILAMRESGCRPSEIFGLTAKQVDLERGIWILTKHKTAKKTQRPRTIYPNPTLRELTRQLVAKHPEGPLFRNRRGGAFNRNAIVCRFRRLAVKLPHIPRVQVYLYHHYYASKALENGVGIAQVAELLGHTSTDMVMQVYSKIGSRVDHMREMATKATGGSPT